MDKQEKIVLYAQLRTNLKYKQAPAMIDCRGCN